MEDDVKLRIKSLELAVEFVGRTAKENPGGCYSSSAINVAKEFHKFLTNPVEKTK